MATVPPQPGSALRRRIGMVLVALLVSAVCVLAGLWQWDRYQDRSRAVASVSSNYGAPVSPLSELLAPGRPLAEQDVWRPVAAVGRYVPDGQVLLRNRPVNGQAGFHVLAPLVVEAGPAAGHVLVVDRGWVPTGPDGSGPLTVPDAPRGTVEVVVHLRADEPAALRSAPAGQVQAISVDQVRAVSAAAGATWPDAAALPAYGMLVSEDGSAPEGVGALPRPDTALGTHVSYAFQWWVFAVGALVGCAVLVRRDVREERPATDGDVGDHVGRRGDVGTQVGRRGDAGARPAMPAVPARASRRRPSAEEEEDALIDAQLGVGGPPGVVDPGGPGGGDGARGGKGARRRGASGVTDGG